MIPYMVAGDSAGNPRLKSTHMGICRDFQRNPARDPSSDPAKFLGSDLLGDPGSNPALL